jgi:hypothetical protein
MADRARNPYDDRRLILEALRGLTPGPSGLVDVTARDLAHATGLGEHRITYALKDLCSEYRARVAATGAGEVLWRFPHPLAGRHSPGPLKRLAAGARRLGLALSRGAARALVGAGYSTWALGAWVLLRGESLDHDPELHGRRLGFYDLVLGFVFGPGGAGKARERRSLAHRGDRAAGTAVAADTAASRRFLAWSDARGGLVSAEEYALHAGLGLEEAEELIAGMAASAGGEARALGPGFLAWSFPRCDRAWTAAPSPYLGMRRLFGNPRASDALAVSLGAANLLFGGAVVTAALAWDFLGALSRGGVEGFGLVALIGGYAGLGLLIAILGVLPLAAGLVGLGLPLARALSAHRENEARRRGNARILAGNRILATGGVVELTGPGQGKRGFGGFFGRAGIGRKAALRMAPRKALDALAAEFGAELDSGADGSLVYRFRRLEGLLGALADERSKAAGRRKEETDIVYDSGCDGDGERGPEP